LLSRDLVVKVADFGMSKAVPKDSKTATTEVDVGPV